MLTREVFVDIIANCEDAEWQAEQDLAKNRRVKPFCFVCMIKKNHDRITRKSARLRGHLLFCTPLPSEYEGAVAGGANLATWLIGVPSKFDTSLGEVKLAPEEEEKDGEEDKEGMEHGQGLL
jgi:hypothetical protein